jgi:tetratricopeptide (TPR) repeat protein
MNLINILNLKASATSLREKTEFINLIFDKIKETGGTCSHFEDFLFDCAIKYKSVGNVKTARDLYEKLYSYQIDKHGIDNKSTLLTANNLSSTIMDIGIEENNYDLKKQSTELREQTLKYMENVFGINGNETLACAYNLAQNYISIDDLEGSCKMYKKSLLGRDITLGKDHEQTLDTVANLARVIGRLASEKLSSNDVSVLQDGLNMVDESLLLFNRALDGKSKVIGINHPSTQNCKDSMDAASSIRMHFISKLTSLGISHDDIQPQMPQELQEEEQDRYTIAQLQEWAGIIKALNPNEIEGNAEYNAAMDFIHNNTNNPQQLDQIGIQMKALLDVISST